MSGNRPARRTGTCPSNMSEAQPSHVEFHENTIPRRGFLKGFIALAGIAAAPAIMGGKGESLVEDGPSFEVLPENVLFEDELANEVASYFHIDRMSYWTRLDDDSSIEMQKIQAKSGWLKEKQLLPIFPAAVMDYKELFESVAEEEDLPVNMLGIIATIESAGSPIADSGVANGLMQVAVKYHRSRIDRLTQKNLGYTPQDDLQRIHALQDATNGSKIGADIIAEYKDIVVNETGLSEDSPIMWLRALASYNGGTDEATKKYKDMPGQSQMYTVHARRFFLDAAIASGLKNKGYSDDEIKTAMASDVVDADAYAYQGTAKGNVTDSLEGHKKLWNTIASTQLIDTDSDMAKKVQERKIKVYSGEHQYALSIPPALRVWLVHNGLGIFDDLPANMDPLNYAK